MIAPTATVIPFARQLTRVEEALAQNRQPWPPDLPKKLVAQATDLNRQTPNEHTAAAWYRTVIAQSLYQLKTGGTFLEAANALVPPLDFPTLVIPGKVQAKSPYYLWRGLAALNEGLLLILTGPAAHPDAITKYLQDACQHLGYAITQGKNEAAAPWAAAAWLYRYQHHLCNPDGNEPDRALLRAAMEALRPSGNWQRLYWYAHHMLNGTSDVLGMFVPNSGLRGSSFFAKRAILRPRKDLFCYQTQAV